MATDGKKVADALRKTLNLPSTKFPMRANAAKRELELHARCVTQAYESQLASSDRTDTFILHDGPPFANGDLHMGHFLNKVLKDIINRYKVLRGYKVEYIPGWDCHGLPIEMKALERLQKEAQTGSIKSFTWDQITPLEVRQRSRQLATEAIAGQKADYQRWGIMADWDVTYETMRPAYEAQQYDILKRMVEDGLIFRGFKPVYWSPSSQTALAESELEYADDHVSKAAYISFRLHSLQSPEAQEKLSQFDQLECVIWTTTPWTIPSNMALCVHEDLTYAVVKDSRSNRFYLVAQDLLDNFQQALYPDEDHSLQVMATLTGKEMEGSAFVHPLYPSQTSPVLLGDHVTTDAGTGVVHTAPGHGQDDYLVWSNYIKSNSQGSVDIACPVDGTGAFTSAAGLDLEGLEVLTDGTSRVLEHLEQNGSLLTVADYKHRYPYDWRTKQPVILRATAQWFAQLTTLHAQAQEIVQQDITTFPASSKRRLEATLASRSEWCISRQRAWGLPIPVFYHKSTGDPLLTSESIAYVQDIIRMQGSDAWFQLSVEELLPPSHKQDSDQYVKGTDTLDVWFDSGSSWHSVLPFSNDQKQAQVYLEGSDQHRGWFQSSLLTSVAMQNISPYQHLITHGFTLDEHGQKMSKSIGNTILPKDFIDGASMALPNKNPKKKPKKVQIPAYGADVLRYWVASTDFTGDVAIGPSVIAKVSDAMRKTRNTVRFLLANLNDFKPNEHVVKYDDMPRVDRYLLHVLDQLGRDVTLAYDSYSFQRVQSAIAHFVSTDLSAFYMEAAKDRLYCGEQGGRDRRSAQTVLWYALQTLSRSIAPVACHTAEDIRMHWRAQIENVETDDVDNSIFTDRSELMTSELDQSFWLPTAREWNNDKLAMEWSAIRQLRLEVNRLVEIMRSDGSVGSQLECNVVIIPKDAKSREILSPLASDAETVDKRTLEDVLLCSGVFVKEDKEDVGVDDGTWKTGECTLTMGNEGMQVELLVTPARGHKCPRCWKYAPEVDESESLLCFRCADAASVKSIEEVAATLVE